MILSFIKRSANDVTIFRPLLRYCPVRKGRDNLLARRLNSSYHQRVFPSDDRFNGGDYALPELRNRSVSRSEILPRVWVESGALCAIARGIAAGRRG